MAFTCSVCGNKMKSGEWWTTYRNMDTCPNEQCQEVLDKYKDECLLELMSEMSEMFKEKGDFALRL